METSDRDLSFGRGQVWEEVQIWDKKQDGVDIARLPTAEGTNMLGIKIWLNYHYQNVYMGLKFILEASKPHNILSWTNKYQKTS